MKPLVCAKEGGDCLPPAALAMVRPRCVEASDTGVHHVDDFDMSLVDEADK